MAEKSSLKNEVAQLNQDNTEKIIAKETTSQADETSELTENESTKELQQMTEDDEFLSKEEQNVDIEDDLLNINAEESQTSDLQENEQQKVQPDNVINQVEPYNEEELISNLKKEINNIQNKKRAMKNQNFDFEETIDLNKLNLDMLDDVQTIKSQNKVSKIENSKKLEKILPLVTDNKSEILRKVLTITSGIIIIVCLFTLVLSTVL